MVSMKKNQNLLKISDRATKGKNLNLNLGLLPHLLPALVSEVAAVIANKKPQVLNKKIIRNNKIANLWNTCLYELIKSHCYFKSVLWWSQNKSI